MCALGGEAVAVSDRLVRGPHAQAQRRRGDVTGAGCEPRLPAGGEGLDTPRRGRSHHRICKGNTYISHRKLGRFGNIFGIFSRYRT